MRELQSLDRSGDSLLSSDRPTDKRMRNHAASLVKLAKKELGETEKRRLLSTVGKTYGRAETEVHALIASGNGTGAEDRIFQALQRFADEKYGNAPTKPAESSALAHT